MKHYYEKIIDQKLIALNEGKLLPAQFKNLISWEIVHFNFSILRNIVNDPLFTYNGMNFKNISKFQKEYLGYLKQKYPRGDKVDAGELSR